MPGYYAITESVDDTKHKSSSKPLRHKPIFSKPICQDLILPSIHPSRSSNVLRTEDVATKAVVDLQISCGDSIHWPSSIYQKHQIYDDFQVDFLEEEDFSAKDFHQDSFAPTNSSSLSPKPPLHIPKSRLKYDNVDARVMEAARALFFQRRRQVGAISNITHLDFILDQELN